VRADGTEGSASAAGEQSRRCRWRAAVAPRCGQPAPVVLDLTEDVLAAVYRIIDCVYRWMMCIDIAILLLFIDCWNLIFTGFGITD
jgi:hypothetical protein